MDPRLEDQPDTLRIGEWDWKLDQPSPIRIGHEFPQGIQAVPTLGAKKIRLRFLFEESIECFQCRPQMSLTLRSSPYPGEPLQSFDQITNL